MKPEPGFYPEMKRCKKCGFMLHERYFQMTNKGPRAICIPCLGQWKAIGIDIYRRYRRKAIDQLGDGYVRKLLTYRTGLSAKQVPQEMVEAKREQLRMVRTAEEMLTAARRQLEKEKK